jgi:hypothetical protein
VLERLIDHAALFPPASMSLPDALAEDRAARESPHAEVLNRFVVPAAKLSELPEGGPPLSVVLGSVDEAALLDGDESVEAVELPLGGARPRPADLVAAYRAFQELGVESYFELVFDEGWRDNVPAAIGAITAVGGRVKVRCGGATVPTVEQLALVIACCREAGVPFKATAGLHHAVRREGEHGFLNVLAAAGAPVAEAPRLLAEEDPRALPLDPAARESFVSFGSCDWRTPVEELDELGLLR